LHFEYPEDTRQMQATLQAFMQQHVIPRYHDFDRIAATGIYPSEVVEPLKALARAAGPWDPFLPGLRRDAPGTRLSNMQYSPLAEIMGRVP